MTVNTYVSLISSSLARSFSSLTPLWLLIIFKSFAMFGLSIAPFAKTLKSAKRCKKTHQLNSFKSYLNNYIIGNIINA